jgi:hypothetical protein
MQTRPLPCAGISQPPQWLEVVGLKRPVDPALAHLDAGEREAISLASELEAILLRIFVMLSGGACRRAASIRVSTLMRVILSREMHSVTSAKSRPFIHVAANHSFSAGYSGVDAIFVNTSARYLSGETSHRRSDLRLARHPGSTKGSFLQSGPSQ